MSQQPTNASVDPATNPVTNMIKDVLTGVVRQEVRQELATSTKWMTEEINKANAQHHSELLLEVRALEAQVKAFVSSAAGAKKAVKKTEIKDDVAAGAADAAATPPATPSDPPAPKSAQFRPKNLWFKDQYQENAEFREKFLEAAVKVNPNFKTIMEADKKVLDKPEGKKDAARADFAYTWMSANMHDFNTKVYVPMHEAAKKGAVTTKTETAKVEKP